MIEYAETKLKSMQGSHEAITKRYYEVDHHLAFQPYEESKQLALNSTICCQLGLQTKLRSFELKSRSIFKELVCSILGYDYWL